ncbi:nuclear pore complex protein Nup154-like isoform X2 [Phlebotomus papatasi]|uniref:nuclear pore complex protein Nup154-like isoform X2 n=2 Tax=Phlebotomus papatasi TaxID=29031 RepID=UPI0024838AD8|nr:nuclear pore complex protein Nup154-like isoform X2 [Phlebotomus papatasi]
MATTSGLNDYDYQNLSSLSLNMKQLNQVATINKVPIPSEILEHLNNIKCHYMMGLFPEIGRAWLTIDSDIFIWAYENDRDVAYFDGLNHLIVSVGLVTPKPNVFVADVKYLLILTTPIEIVILGVMFGDSAKTVCSPNRSVRGVKPFEELHISRPIFVLNTDNVSIMAIEGTADGRIFLGGRDGSLFELQYQAESNWFGRRCKKVNHSQSLVSYMVPGFLKIFSENYAVAHIAIDNSRQMLYVLFEKGAIEAWELEYNDNIRRVGRVTHREIIQAAVNMVKTVDPTIFKNITVICPLNLDDSPHLHLIAVTQSGVRFYFSTTTIFTTKSTLESIKPQGLYLLHIRLPPGYTPNTQVGKPRQVHSAFYHHGSLLMVATSQQDQDLLWSLSSEPFPHRPYLTESSTVMQLDGQVCDLAQVKDKDSHNLTISPMRATYQPTKIVLLTNQGAHIVALLKPMDLLQQLLTACRGPHHEAVKAYFQSQTEAEACATSLMLACTEASRNSEMAIWATQAFFLYGGEAQYRQAGQYNTNNTFAEQQGSQVINTIFTSRPASAIQQSLLQQTQLPSTSLQNLNTQSSFTISQAVDMCSNFQYSDKHTGLYLHVSRLLSPIWKRRCLLQNASFTSSITLQDCGQILSDLYAIKAFLAANSNASTVCTQSQSIAQSSTGFYQYLPANNLRRPNNMAEDAKLEEKKSLDALTRFIRHTCEVVALWKLICEHQFHILIGGLSREQQNILAACTFRDLILCRPDTCSQLIIVLINFYLNDNASVGSISAKLRDVCPTLYSHEEAVSHKATEILLMSKTCIDNEEKNEKLITALKLCKGAAPNLPLNSICQQFTAANFYQGVIELCAVCASKIDINGAALHFYKNGESKEDREGFMAYSARNECYKEIKLMLEQVYQQLCNMEINGNTEHHHNTEIADVNSQIFKIVALAIQTPDILLHIAVYEWLLSHRLLGELLGVSESSLGLFLSNSLSKYPDNQHLADLLWKYHERNGHHSSAAKILDNLASMNAENITLERRIEYLSKAVLCMRSETIGYSVQNGVLWKALEDKLEFAQVQKVIRDTISSVGENDFNTENAVKLLNSHLYNMTQLYIEFAEPFNLWECKLKILSVSHHNDAVLIEAVWTHIFDEELNASPLISADERMRRLLTKFQCLAREYSHTGNCFPLSFLVYELEVRACKLHLQSSPVPEALIAMKIDTESLLDIYTRMVAMNDRIWLTEHNEWYLVDAAAQLVGKKSGIKEAQFSPLADSERKDSLSINVEFVKFHLTRSRTVNYESLTNKKSDQKAIIRFSTIVDIGSA